MNETYLLLDLIVGTQQFHLWSGEEDGMEWAGLLPDTETYRYASLDHATIQPLRSGVAAGFPAMQLGLALPQGHALDALLRTTRTHWQVAMRTASNISPTSELVLQELDHFLGDAVQHEKTDGLWNIEVRHFLHRLEADAGEPAMGLLAHQRQYPGDLGFGYMEQSHNFLSGWSP